MKNILLKGALASFFAMSFAAAANAAVVSGDFRTESDLPDYGSNGPLVYENLGQSVGAGYELDDSHFVENPDNWGGGVVWLDFDASTNILTLDSQDTWDFQTFDAWVSNIMFDNGSEVISSITMLTNNLTDSGVIPSLSFTDNSVHVSYDYVPDVFNFTGGTATFQIGTTVSAVPEPSTYALMLGGLGLVGFMAARRRKA